jgi:hypothetical protein
VCVYPARDTLLERGEVPIQTPRVDVDFPMRNGGVRQTAAMCCEDIAAGEPSGDPAGIAARDDGQAAHVFVDDVVGGFAQRVVLEDDGGRAVKNLAEGRGFGCLRVKDIAASEGAEEKSVAIKDWKALVLRAGGM